MVKRVITLGMLDVFAPEHERTSCSDSNRCNGLDSALHHGRTGPRCTRCAMLEIVYEADGEIPDDFIVTARIYLKLENQ